jgi:predicted HicB family RNase H-like nuclease
MTQRATETVYVTKGVHRQLKKAAADQDKSIGELVAWLIAKHLKWTLGEKK